METIMDTHDYPEPDLAARLAVLRTGIAQLDTPRCVEKELMQAFGAAFAPRKPWYRRLSLPEWSAAGAGVLLSAAVLVLLLVPPRLAGDLHATPPLLRFDDGAAFIALDSFERIDQESAPRLVEAEVPRTMLAALGLPVTPENAGEPVYAEMLVGASGEPLALRLSSIN
ncbi:hypothetical protein [Massilia sp. GCM10023247]|uniref:hypothetical protein n=1 Tax=Massilia sp. GCM10023247 TaxID=3252643 RepID=UPI00360D3954